MNGSIDGGHSQSPVRVKADVSPMFGSGHSGPLFIRAEVVCRSKATWWHPISEISQIRNKRSNPGQAPKLNSSLQ